MINRNVCNEAQINTYHIDSKLTFQEQYCLLANFDKTLYFPEIIFFKKDFRKDLSINDGNSLLIYNDFI